MMSRFPLSEPDLQLLKCVLRDLLEEKEVQRNLLQVHLNGTDSSPNLMLFIHNLRNQAFVIFTVQIIGHTSCL